MKTDETHLKALIDRQTESLNIEFKRWIDPTSPEGLSKIVKACIAMRNNNSGYLFIGFDEESRQPDFKNTPTEDVRKIFNLDEIQSRVSRYAYPQFEVEVHFVEKDGKEYPVICVAEGIKTPVASRSELRSPTDNSKLLIKQNIVYVRTLNSNGSPSTSEATYQDWEKLTLICFDNREADIGRFVRRHIANVDKSLLQSLLSSMTEVSQPPPKTYEELAIDLLDCGKNRFEASIKGRYSFQLPPHGSWEVSCVINSDEYKNSANQTFLNLISASNPSYTGWPIWLNSRQFSDKATHPYVFEDAWEANIVSLDREWANHIDFWRIDPRGRFYLRRALEDDLKTKIEPLKLLDFGLPIWRVGESLAVGLAFAKAMGYDAESTNLSFSFRWSRLKSRTLTSWADPARHIFERTATQDSVVSTVNIPLSTPLSTIYQYVDVATKALFQIFDGFEVSTSVVEELTKKMLGRSG